MNALRLYHVSSAMSSHGLNAYYATDEKTSMAYNSIASIAAS